MARSVVETVRYSPSPSPSRPLFLSRLRSRPCMWWQCRYSHRMSSRESRNAHRHTHCYGPSSKLLYLSTQKQKTAVYVHRQAETTADLAVFPAASLAPPVPVAISVTPTFPLAVSVSIGTRPLTVTVFTAAAPGSFRPTTTTGYAAAATTTAATTAVVAVAIIVAAAAAAIAAELAL